ncbi:MAG: hypothetical protein QOC81_3092 [Thermoanaerobaculia bacterium]|jgi:hypothetical protein|nr:hypothetical protein [Thermoanaerobaculia bacterium]
MIEHLQHLAMAKQMTIRGISEDVATELHRLSRERGRSVNTLVLEILGRAVGIEARRERLAHYATWTPEDLAQVQDAVAAQRHSG